METRTCKECGQEKPASDFSKSYPNRCRECVAKAAREKRQEAKDRKPEGQACGQDPTYSPLPDIFDGVTQIPGYWEEVWEARHYKLAQALFFKLLATDASNPGIAASRAKDAADKFINIMRDNDQ